MFILTILTALFDGAKGTSVVSHNLLITCSSFLASYLVSLSLAKRVCPLLAALLYYEEKLGFFFSSAERSQTTLDFKISKQGNICSLHTLVYCSFFAYEIVFECRCMNYLSLQRSSICKEQKALFNFCIIDMTGFLCIFFLIAL